MLHDIACVYTQPPRPAGRGKKLTPSPVHQTAEAAGLTVRTPLRFKDPEVIAEFEALQPDLAVVVAYGMILPQAALDAPRLGCFNLHASLLPRWRGAAPIQRALMAGDAEAGVCVMRVTLALDEGPVLSSAATDITPEDTGQTLHDRLAALGAPLMAETMADVMAGQAVETPQNEEGATYAAKIDKAEARIDWSAPADVVDRHIRGLSPFPGAWFEADAGQGAERVKVLMSVLEAREGEIAPPGTVLDAQLTIACGRGAVRLSSVQRAGKAPAEAAQFLRGFALTKGDRVA